MQKLTVLIGGREALPVRAIPYVAGWSRYSPDVVAKNLARTKSFPFAQLQNTTAFRLSGNTTVKVLPKEWHEVLAQFEALEKRLKREEESDAEGYEQWLREATPILPPAVFVWRDEFESDFRVDCDNISRAFRRDGDDELNFSPMLSDEQRKMILEGTPPSQFPSSAPPPIKPVSGSGGLISHARRTTAKPPNWNEWKHTPEVLVWQACALSLGIDPHSMKGLRDGWMAGPGHGPFFEPESFPTEDAKAEFELRQRVLLANLSNREFFSPGILSMDTPGNHGVRLSEFAAWAVSEMKWVDLPPQLVAMVQKPETQTEAPAMSTGDGRGRDTGQTITTHTSKTTRSNILDPVIEVAKQKAVAPDNPQSVWAELQKLADSPTRPAPLLGFIEAEGVKYQDQDGVKFLTKKNLQDRMSRAKPR